MSSDIDEDRVTCARHGKRPSGIICKHLIQATGRGFYRPTENPDAKTLHGWCQDCEDFLQLQGEVWPEGQETVDNFLLVCDCCFFDIMELNYRPYQVIRSPENHICQ